MTASEQKDIGKLLAIAEMTQDSIKDIHDKMDDWTANGCPQGVRVGKEVEAVKTRVDSLYTKVVALGLLVAAGGHGAGAIIKALIQ